MFSSKKRRLTKNRTLAVELLEQRSLPSWSPMGPSPQLEAGYSIHMGAAGGELSGRVSTLTYLRNN